MEDNFDFQDQSHEEENISRFEEMLRNDSFCYFDPSELEEIIEHYLQLDEPHKVMRCIELGLSLHPESPSLLLKQAMFKFERGEFKESLKFADKAESYEPNNDEVLLLKAQIFSQIEDHTRCIEYLWKASRVCEVEDRADVLLDIASTYQIKSDFKEAANVLKGILQEFPGHKQALYELAFCYDVAGELDECIRFYQQYLDDDPYSYVAWYNLGNSLCKQARFKEAVEAFDFAIAIKDDLSSAHFNRANALSHLGKYQEAIDALGETVKHEGCHPMTLNYIGENYEKLEEYEQAMSHYQHASELDPTLPDPWIGMGIVKDLQGNTGEALKCLEKAVKLDEDNHINWIILGNAHEKVDQYDQAEDCYRRSIEIKSDFAEAWLDYSNLLFETNKMEQAISAVVQGLEACEHGTDLLEYRLVAYLYAKGENQEALAQLEEALQVNFGGHKDLLEYYPEIGDRSEVIQLIESYSR